MFPFPCIFILNKRNDFCFLSFLSYQTSWKKGHLSPSLSPSARQCTTFSFNFSLPPTKYSLRIQKLLSNLISLISVGKVKKSKQRKNVGNLELITKITVKGRRANFLMKYYMVFVHPLSFCGPYLIVTPLKHGRCWTNTTKQDKYED